MTSTADTPFVFELASGVYVDAKGQLFPGVPPQGMQAYKSPWQLPINPAKVRDALKDVQSALDGAQKNKQFLLDLHVWAGDDTGADVLKFIKGVSSIAGAIAPVFTVLAVAAQLAEMFGLFSKGPDPLTTLINQRFDALTEIMVAQSEQAFLTNIGMIRGNYLGVTGGAYDLLHRKNITLAQYLIAQHDAQQILNTNSGTILAMLDPAGSWMIQQDVTRFDTWKGLQARLFNMADGEATPCLFRPPGNMFDHRPMVPFVTEVTINYLTCLRTLSPEYRSTGEFVDKLVTFAEGLEALANQMRRETLARTIYTADDFDVVLMSTEVVLPEAGSPISRIFGHHAGGSGEPVVRTGRWPVGAIDVLQHDDDYVAARLAEERARQNLPLGVAPASLRAGCMDYAWTPPAKLVEYEFGQGGAEYSLWRIDNPQECADAANAQSEKDYAYLLVLSGYAQLIHLAALCRHEVTEPDRSQSASTSQQPLLIYSDESDSKVTVESHWILNGKHVTSAAVERSRGCWAMMKFKTQPVMRSESGQLRYRLALRTLSEFAPYDEYFKTEYVPAAVAFGNPDDHPGFMKLSIERNTQLLVDSQTIIAEWTPTPRDGVNHHYEGGTVSLQADTYNWYTPVADIFGSVDSFKDLGGVAAALEAVGKTPGAATAGPPATSGQARVVGSSSRLIASQLIDFAQINAFAVGQPPEMDPSRSAREKVRKTVEVQWSADWDGDELTVSLQTGPEARSLRLLVVLEELFQLDNDNIMETACEVPMDGLVSLVPQRFFDDEIRAMVQAVHAIADRVGRVPLDVGDIHPPGPVEIELGLVDPRRMEQTLRMLQAAHPREAVFKANFNARRSRQTSRS